MRIENRHYDPFTVESMILGYRMTAASAADKAAATQELTRQGYSTDEIALRLYTTRRHIVRLRTKEVVPLPPLPDWCDDYERQWPTCEVGHELTPDNVGRRGCNICTADYRHRYDAEYRDQERYREQRREWGRKQRERRAAQKVSAA